MLHLWGATTSRTLRAAWALHELSLDYVAHPILPRTGETKTAEFTRINPRQKIPVLQDGDFTIAESPAIIAYLSDTYGTDDNRLVPRNARLRATWLEWCFHIAMELDATSLYVMRRHRRPCAERRPALPRRRALHQRRYAAHDLPGLGDQLRRAGAADLLRLRRPHRRPARLPGRLARQPCATAASHGET